MKYKCLSIGGFDSSGGAGIQADLKTFSALGCYGMTVLTALPIQNTCSVKNCYKIPVSAILEQLQVIFEDIIPDSIKIGMLYSAEIVELVGGFLNKNAKGIPIVLDPVMIAKSGDPLLQSDALEALKAVLIPVSTIITPNLPEAYALVGQIKDREVLAERILDLGARSILLKGGHAEGNASDDLFMERGGMHKWLRSRRINSKNTHGTGCTLSSAVCALIAHQYPLLAACKYAKRYLFKAILASETLSPGRGNGPVHHFHHILPINYSKF